MINCWDDSSHSKPAGYRRSWRRVSIFVAAKRGLSRRAPPDSQPTQAPSPLPHLIFVPAKEARRLRERPAAGEFVR
jgi:hypothetical protein